MNKVVEEEREQSQATNEELKVLVTMTSNVVLTILKTKEVYSIQMCNMNQTEYDTIIMLLSFSLQAIVLICQ